MATIIKHKVSAVAGNPTTLALGEMAYSYLADNGSNGGDRLYIGTGTETAGNAANHEVIGGKYFTSKLSSTPGVLTASSAILVDALKKIDNIKVGNLDLINNTLSSTNTNGDVIVAPNGTGNVIISGNKYPKTAGSAGQVLLTDGLGQTSWSTPAASSFNLAANTGTLDVFNGGETLTFTGSGAIDTVVGNNVITFSAKDATSTVKGVATFNASGFVVTAGDVSLKANVLQSIVTGSGTMTPTANAVTFTGTNSSVTHVGTTITFAPNIATSAALGIASFNTSSFAVAAGDVTIKAAGVSNSQLVNSAVTIGTTSVSLGATVTTFAGLTNVTVGNINIVGNTISTTNANGNLILAPNGTGVVDAGVAKFTSSAVASGPNDIPNKAYVDAVASGVKRTHDPVVAATTGALATLSGGVVTYNNGTAGVGATLTFAVALNTLDTVALALNDRILVKNEATLANNGIYIRTSATVWTRATDFDGPLESQGGDTVFVSGGLANIKTGWIVDAATTTYGTSPINFVQNFGAGTYIGGNGLTLTGTTFDINVNPTGGIRIVADALELNPTVSGNGLTLTNGVLDVGTGTGITVNADGIQISATYAGQASITTVGALTSGSLGTGFTTVGVAQGGTGAVTLTARGALYGNGTGAVVATAGSIIDGSFLREDATGNPYWSNIIDGGTY
jgi:hypothetical protein